MPGERDRKAKVSKTGADWKRQPTSERYYVTHRKGNGRVHWQMP